jgi:hypothetical protein
MMHKKVYNIGHRLQSDMRSIADRFKARADRTRAEVHRAVSPTADDFAALDEEVEKLHQSKFLIIDDFSKV